MSRPKLIARWQGTDFNPALTVPGDLTFHHPDRDGKIVSRILTAAFPDEVLSQIEKAGYDLKTLRLSISPAISRSAANPAGAQATAEEN